MRNNRNFTFDLRRRKSERALSPPRDSFITVEDRDGAVEESSVADEDRDGLVEESSVAT